MVYVLILTHKLLHSETIFITIQLLLVKNTKKPFWSVRETLSLSEDLN
jgi:hypothetical protein